MLFAQNGWQVVLLGVDAPDTRKLRFRKIAGVTVRYFPVFASAPRWIRKVCYLGYVFWVMLHIAILRPEWIYLSDIYSTFIGVVLRKLCAGIKLIYHEHDIPAFDQIQPFWKKYHFKILKIARLCIVPSAGRIEHIQKNGAAPGKIITVWNCPARVDVANIKTHPKNRRPSFLRLYYHGSIVPQRIPYELFEAISKFGNKCQIIIAGYETLGGRGYLNQIREFSRRLNIMKQIQIVEAIPRADLFKFCSVFDVGISLMPFKSDDPNHLTMAGASNKAFDYLACGLALLVSDLPDWNDMFVKPGYARACKSDNIESIAGTLDWFMTHPKQTREMGMMGREKVLREWNYENQFLPVIEKMKKNSVNEVNIKVCVDTP